MTVVYTTGKLFQLYMTVNTAFPTGTSVSAGINCQFLTGAEAVINATTGISTSVGIECIFGPTKIEATTGGSVSTGRNAYFLTASAHGCKLADYRAKGRQLNILVVSGRETATGNLVFGYADDSSGDNESSRDPQIDYYRDDSVNTFDYAESVAGNILEKQRLLLSRGKMLIFPNVAQQQWDVISSSDTVLNPSENFRISGWNLRYNRDQRFFKQELKLTNT